MNPVTDPAILEQLNGAALKPVTDPALLAQLNGEPAQQEQPILDQTLAATAKYSGLGARALYKGVAGMADIIPGTINVANTISDKVTGETTPKLPMPVSELMDKYLNAINVPSPETTGQRLASDVISGASGGGILGLQGLISGATGMGSAGTARELGAGEFGQTVSGLVGGGIGGLLSSPKAEPIARQTVESINPDQATLNAVAPVNQRFLAEKARENQLWRGAQESAIGTHINGENIVPAIRQNINSALGETAQNLADEDLKPLNSIVSQIDKFARPERKYTEPYVDPISGITREPAKLIEDNYAGVPVGRLIAIRRGLSNLAGTATDGRLRNASGRALSEFDKSIEDSAQNAVMSGDENAIAKYMKAIDQSRSIYQRFGTDRKSGQSGIFEKIITKENVNNSQLIDAMGTTARGKESTSQVVSRLLDNAGSDREVVRKNIANGYIYKAIKRSMKELDTGETIVIPGRLRTEINRLTTESRATGGMGDDVRKLVFTNEDLAKLEDLKKNAKDAKSITGKILSLAEAKIPMAGQVIPKPVIMAGRSTKKSVEKYLNEDTKKAIESFNGIPISYAPILMNTPQYKKKDK